MDYSVREASKADIPKLIELEKLCFSDPWTANLFEDEMDNPLVTYHLYFHGDKLIGYIGFLVVVDECQINNVAVHPDYRRKGMGKEMVGNVIRQTEEEGIKFWLLEVRANNEAAIMLYEGFGFVNVGLRRNYYGEGEDAILMTREIK